MPFARGRAIPQFEQIARIGQHPIELERETGAAFGKAQLPAGNAVMAEDRARPILETESRSRIRRAHRHVDRARAGRRDRHGAPGRGIGHIGRWRIRNPAIGHALAHELPAGDRGNGPQARGSAIGNPQILRDGVVAGQRAGAGADDPRHREHRSPAVARRRRLPRQEAVDLDVAPLDRGHINARRTAVELRGQRLRARYDHRRIAVGVVQPGIDRQRDIRRTRVEITVDCGDIAAHPVADLDGLAIAERAIRQLDPRHISRLADWVGIDVAGLEDRIGPAHEGQAVTVEELAIVIMVPAAAERFLGRIGVAEAAVVELGIAAGGVVGIAVGFVDKTAGHR